MINKNHWAFVVLFLSCKTFGGEFFIAPEVGYSKLSVDDNFAVSGENESEGALALGFSAGYQFDSNVLIESNISHTSTYDFFDAFDDYKINEFRILLGYRFNVSKRFKVIPKIGFSVWDLETEEGAFLNPGPEENDSFSGEDFFGQLNIEFPVNDKFNIYVYYGYYDIDFGSIETTRMGFKFNF